MVILYIIVTILFSIFLFISSIDALEQNYVIKDNQTTIFLTIQPNNTIIVESEDNAKVEQLLEKLTVDDQLTKGDILIASSTIFAFFGFGSFLIIRFQSRQRIEELIESAQVILASIGGIQIFHLIVILSIAFGSFNMANYSITIIATALLLVLSLLHVGKIFTIENKHREDTADEVVDILTRDLINQGIIKESLEKQISDLRRENKRLTQEKGEY